MAITIPLINGFKRVYHGKTAVEFIDEVFEYGYNKRELIMNELRTLAFAAPEDMQDVLSEAYMLMYRAMDIDEHIDKNGTTNNYQW